MPFALNSDVFTPELRAFLPVIATVLIAWFLNMGLTGWIARRRGREGGVWAVLAFFTGPIALLAILLKHRQDPIPEVEAERLAARPPAGVRLVSDTQLELEVEGGTALVPGEETPRVDGRPGFRIFGSSAWRWSDGRPMSDEDRADLRLKVRAVGRHAGWNLVLDADDAI